jgi:D-psicose/D-tagatose/L-ribulose 3-epimerase
MHTLGIHANTLAGASSGRELVHTVFRAASLGYSLIELPWSPAFGDHLSDLRAALRTSHLEAAVAVALPRELHPPLNPEHACAWLRRALDFAEVLGSRWLWGGLAYGRGYVDPADRDPAARVYAIEMLTYLAEDARRRGITLALEPASRFDSHLVNTVAEAAEIVDAVASPALRLVADTYTMNMEETDLAAALLCAREDLAVLHVSENQLGSLGSGTIPWPTIWKTLTMTRFEGPLVFRADPNRLQPPHVRSSPPTNGAEPAAAAFAFLAAASAKIDGRRASRNPVRRKSAQPASTTPAVVAAALSAQPTQKRKGSTRKKVKPVTSPVAKTYRSR